MGVDEIKTAGLAIEIIGVARLKLLFQIDSRVGIILARYRQDGLERAIDPGVSRSKKLYLMSAPHEVSTEAADNTFCSAVGPRRDGNVDAGDLSDSHGKIVKLL